MSSFDSISLVETPPQGMDERLIKTLIVHRDPSIADVIRSVLSASQYEVVADCVSGVEAMEAFARHQPEVIWLDVKAPKAEMLKDLPAAKTNPLIFYLLEEDSPVLNHLTREEMSFVLPRVKDLELAAMITQMRPLLSRFQRKRSQSLLSLFFGQPSSRQNGRFAFKSEGKLLVVDIDDIVSVEAEERHSRLFTKSSSYSLKYSVAQTCRMLPPKLFYRVSSSAVVNVQSIRELTCGWGSEKFAILDDGRRLRIAKAQTAELVRMIDITWGMTKIRR